MAIKRDRAKYMREYRAKGENLASPTVEGQSQKIAAEMEKSFQESLKRLEDGLKTTKAGSSQYLKFSEAIDDLRRKHREELASRGLTPRHLGAADVTPRLWIAEPLPGGSVRCTEYPVDQREKVLTAAIAKNQAVLAKLAAGEPNRKEEEAKLNADFGLDEDGVDHSYDQVRKETDDDEQ